MLEGTSVGQGATAPARDDSLPSIAPAPAEPRREIWFRRKVRLIPAIHELWTFRELILTLAERDLRVRYKQAVLGIAWAVISPIVLMVAFTVLFTKVTHINTYAPGVPYVLFSYHRRHELGG
jgi:hypothetical protein